MGQLLNSVKGKPDKQLGYEGKTFTSGPGFYGTSAIVYPVIWNGEKKTGAAGPIINYWTDHYALRARSRQIYKESPFVQGVTKKIIGWVVGEGLRLKCEPMMGAANASDQFCKTMEGFWGVYANSKEADYAGQRTLNQLHADAMDEALQGGDVLAVLRINDVGIVQTQLIDGKHVMNPSVFATSNGYDLFLENGNRCRKGVEIDEAGKHIAYHVRNNNFEFIRIKAYDEETGMRIAYLYSIFKESSESTRGMPIFASGVETAKKVDRISDAALAGEEGRQNIVFSTKTELNGDNQNPFKNQRVTGSRSGPGVVGPISNPNDNLGIDASLHPLNQAMTSVTNATTVIMPKGQELVMHSSDMTVDVPAFCEFHFKILSVLVNMPMCVAMSDYQGSFSAARMGGKDWENTFMNMRFNSAIDFLKPIYELQTYVLANMMKVEAPGLMALYGQKDRIGVEAYLFCRFEGGMFPDIDPLKTVKFIREALGQGLSGVPLMNLERAAELIDQSGLSDIIAEDGRYLQEADTAGLPREDKMTVDDEEEEEKEGETAAPKPSPKPAKKIPAKAKPQQKMSSYFRNYKGF